MAKYITSIEMVSSFTKDAFFVNQKVLKQQQGCRGIMLLIRIPAETLAKEAFSFPGFVSLSTK